jgi:hypothetical protein
LLGRNICQQLVFIVAFALTCRTAASLLTPGWLAGWLAGVTGTCARRQPSWQRLPFLLGCTAAQDEATKQQGSSSAPASAVHRSPHLHQNLMAQSAAPEASRWPCGCQACAHTDAS